jgi:hypothetical protein
MNVQSVRRWYGRFILYFVSICRYDYYDISLDSSAPSCYTRSDKVLHVVLWGGQKGGAMRVQEFVCIDCDRAEVWTKDDTIDGVFADYRKCEYCEQQVCGLCNDLHEC